MAIAGLLAVVAPVVVTSEPAAAAQTSASADGSLTFARYGDGAAVTCTAGFTAPQHRRRKPSVCPDL